MNENQPNILFVGDARREEFRLVWERLPEHFQSSAVIKPGIPEALAGFTGRDEKTDFSKIVLLLQSFPGEFLQEEVECLRRRFPLAPPAVIYGSWCEGEERSGKPLAGVARFSWPQWVLAGPRELEYFFRGELSVFSFPGTLTPEDRFLRLWELEKKRRDTHVEGVLNHRQAEFCRNKERPYSLFVFTAEVEQALTLTGVFQKDQTLRHMIKCTHFQDFTPMCITPPDFVLADFSDFPSFNAEIREKFRAMIHRYPRATFFAFLNFPDVAAWRCLEGLGVRHIFIKPFFLTDFLYHFLAIFREKKTTAE